MTKREVVRLVLEGDRPPYVPWSIGLTEPARRNIEVHLGSADLESLLDDHFLGLGSAIGFFEDLGEGLVRDVFGVVWDRRVDRDIGTVAGRVLPEPTLRGYRFPDPRDPRFFADIPEKIAARGDRFRVFRLGFSLYERAWTLRGMENLLLDFYDHPGFVRDLLRAIADYAIAQVREALLHPIDAVYFGDDWGYQRGLQMGRPLWEAFIRPELERMVAVVREAGKYVMIHSCGRVDELLDALIEIGVACFNPFQPEVMDVDALLSSYRGRLCFHGGLSTQRTLPHGSPEDVRGETARLLAGGREGGYIFAPAHDVPADVPPENILAFLEVVKGQPGYGDAAP